MEKTNKLVEIIDQVFDTICIIYDETELNFDSGEVLVKRLQKAFGLAATMNTKGITLEVWNATSKWKREDKIIDLMNLKFERLVTFKPGVYEIGDMNKEILKDLSPFFQKQTQININYSSLERNQIEKYYIAIGHRLLKANLDLDKEMSQLMKMQEDELSSIENEELLMLKSNNIKLQSYKQVEFVSVLSEMYDNNFFIPVDSSIPFSKTDILIAFNEFLHTSLESNESIDIKPVLSKQLVNRIEGQKYFSDYLLHEKREKLADEIKKEFSTEKGKAIRLLLHVLENNNPPFITIGYRQAKEIHIAMSDFFGRNIGKYQSVFDYKVDVKLDHKDLENISLRLNHILSKL